MTSLYRYAFQYTPFCIANDQFRVVKNNVLQNVLNVLYYVPKFHAKFIVIY